MSRRMNAYIVWSCVLVSAIACGTFFVCGILLFAAASAAHTGPDGVAFALILSAVVALLMAVAGAVAQYLDRPVTSHAKKRLR